MQPYLQSDTQGTSKPIMLVTGLITVNLDVTDPAMNDGMRGLHCRQRRFEKASRSWRVWGTVLFSMCPISRVVQQGRSLGLSIEPSPEREIKQMCPAVQAGLECTEA